MTPSARKSAGPTGPGGARAGDEGASSAYPDAGDAADTEVADADAEVADGEIVDEEQAVEHDIDELLNAARRERDEYLDMLRRVQADFENYKKRMIRQQTDHLERAAEGVVVKLLPTLDAFDLAREHLGEGDDVSTEGKALIQASALLSDTLAKEGLERIEDVGAPFDPTVHEAVDHVSGDDAGGPEDGGTVVDAVLRTGYRWKGRVIRPAMVRVRG